MLTQRTRQRLIEALEGRVLLARPLGIDVSDFQTTINWTSVKNAGYTYAWTKSTEGFTFNATSYTNHIIGANAAGVLIAPYHYARPDNNSAADEVTHFLQIAGAQVAAGYLVPMLDVENPVQAGDTVDTKAEMSAWVNAWCQGVLNATGVRPIVYTYVSYASTWLDSSVTQWPLWMAQYPTNPNPQTGAPSGTAPWASNAWKFWQYSSTTSVPGITGNCDVDVFNGTPTELNSWIIMANPTTPTSPANNGQVTGSPASLNWNAVANATSYDVYVDSVFKANVATNSWNVSPALSTGAHSWYVVARNNSGSRTGSTWNFTVNPAVTLNAPTNIQVTGFTSSSVSLSWTDTSSGEQAYLVERKTGAAGSWAQIANIAANSQSYIDDFVNAGTNYVYRVRAYGGGTTFGSYSGEASATTYAQTPTGLIASDGAFFDRVELSWDPSEGAVSYQLYRSTTNDPLSAALFAPSGSTSFQDVGATAGTTYFYWVAARDSLNRLTVKSAVDSGFRALDNTPPEVISSGFVYQTAPQTVKFVFSEDVSASLDPSLLSVTRSGSVDPVDVTNVVWDANTNSAYFELAGPLSDDNYHAVLDGSLVDDLAGNPLGGSVPVDFFSLLGDASRDGSVDTTDFNLLAANFAQSGKLWDDGDFNFDGTVDTTDFNILAGKFGSSRPPAALPSMMRPASVASSFSVSPITHHDRLVEELGISDSSRAF
jgi:GH25 family lysozyme M1 (1,4-beta-N-acetylmuramidase)